MHKRARGRPAHPYTAAIAGLLSDLRALHHLSRLEVSTRLGVTPSAVSRWETGSSCPTLPAEALLDCYARTPVQRQVLATLLDGCEVDGG